MADAIRKLQSLTQVTIDSAQGYETAAERAKTPHLKQVLSEAGAKRRRLVDRLNGELVRLGGDRQTSGSASGTAHHVWTRISDAFGNGDEKATDRVEEGEDYLEEKFRDAAADGDFSPDTLELLRGAHAEVKEGERMTDRLEEQYD